MKRLPIALKRIEAFMRDFDRDYIEEALAEGLNEKTPAHDLMGLFKSLTF